MVPVSSTPKSLELPTLNWTNEVATDCWVHDWKLGTLVQVSNLLCQIWFVPAAVIQTSKFSPTGVTSTQIGLAGKFFTWTNPLPELKESLKISCKVSMVTYLVFLQVPSLYHKVPEITPHTPAFPLATIVSPPGNLFHWPWMSNVKNLGWKT